MKLQLRVPAALLLIICIIGTPRHVLAEGKRIAILVGVGAYDPKLSLGHLNAEADCDSLSAALLGLKAGWEVTKIGTGTVPAGERKDILGVLGITGATDGVPEFGGDCPLKGLSHDDVVLFYFSGHGLTDEAGADHMIPSDARKDASGAWAGDSLVPVAWAKRALLKSGAGKAIILLDACRSVTRGDQTIPIIGVRSPVVGPHDSSAAALGASQELFDVRSCSDTQAALEGSADPKQPGRLGGAFTQLFVSFLTDKDAQRKALPNGGQLSLKAVFEAAKAATINYASKQGTIQTPRMVPEDDSANQLIFTNVLVEKGGSGAGLGWAPIVSPADARFELNGQPVRGADDINSAIRESGNTLVARREGFSTELVKSLDMEGVRAYAEGIRPINLKPEYGYVRLNSKIDDAVVTFEGVPLVEQDGKFIVPVDGKLSRLGTLAISRSSGWCMPLEKDVEVTAGETKAVTGTYKDLTGTWLGTTTDAVGADATFSLLISKSGRVTLTVKANVYRFDGLGRIVDTRVKTTRLTQDCELGADYSFSLEGDATSDINFGEQHYSISAVFGSDANSLSVHAEVRNVFGTHSADLSMSKRKA